MNGLRSLFLFFSFFGVELAFAQTACPVGTQPGAMVCGPAPNSSQPQQPAAPVTRYPTGEWLDRWGAFSYDSDVESLGVSRDESSKEVAELVATQRCINAGGSNCRIFNSYKNACVAVARQAAGAGLFFSTRPKVKQASKVAIDGCKKNYGGQCDVWYSACSEQVFNKF
ncbi:DUF4189 domain-containing protein [Flavobacterium sp. MXW15]|uniref:DUF4189 domain-containing protein n=1 Tax=Xanthomonas chitinilytica TaxID=2989819 RepID=A0ABT3JRH6_9XANT|nr:DUF4189 domain-containing protein [Xanthomonas sp. H13-6]MCW4453854.1 DUF4189 domain-containing protein [Flavobacterium sp. MXW15]MCW4471098.1 DUF4189 domain-containing protein [Xanthomonas sp. H13-6]